MSESTILLTLKATDTIPAADVAIDRGSIGGLRWLDHEAGGLMCIYLHTLKPLMTCIWN